MRFATEYRKRFEGSMPQIAGLVQLPHLARCPLIGSAEKPTMVENARLGIGRAGTGTIWNKGLDSICFPCLAG